MNTLPRLRTGLHYEADVDGYLVSLTIVRGDEMVASHYLGENDHHTSTQDFNDWLNISVGYLKNYFPELFDLNYLPNQTPIAISDTSGSLLEALQDVVDRSNNENNENNSKSMNPPIVIPELLPHLHYQVLTTDSSVYLSINNEQGNVQVDSHIGPNSGRELSVSEFNSILRERIAYLKSTFPSLYGPGTRLYLTNNRTACTLLEALSNFTYSQNQNQNQNQNQDQPDPLTLPKLNEGYSYEISKDSSDNSKFQLSIGKVNPTTNGFPWKIFSYLSTEKDVQNMTDDELRAELHSAVTYLQSAFPKHFDKAVVQPNSAEDRYNSILEEMTTPNNPSA